MRPKPFFFVTLAALLVAPGAGLAQNAITQCSQACAVDCQTANLPQGLSCVNASDTGGGFQCVVSTDIACTGADTGIELYQGADLKFVQGSVIECSGTGDCGSAVVIQEAGSTVCSDQNAANELGGIRGKFFVGVDCQAQNDSEVDRIRVDGGLVSIFNCETVTNNILEGADRTYLTINRGISWNQKANSGSAADTASGNLIREKVWSITVGGTAKAKITDNTLLTTKNSSQAFQVAEGALWQIEDNAVLGSGDTPRSQFFYGVDPAIIVGPDPPSGSFPGESGNLCNVDDHPGCQDCIDDGSCIDYVPQ